jgi:hypothetical protein
VPPSGLKPNSQTAKQPYARSAPSAPPPLAPPAKAPVEKGCQAVVEVCYLIYLGYFV